MTLSRRNFLLSSFLATGAVIDVQMHAMKAFASQSNPDITHGSRAKSKIALTFHAAGNIDSAHGILKILNATNTPASIMAVGVFLKANPAIAPSIIDAGHDLGNHTMNHTQMKTIAGHKVDSEIENCAKILFDQIGNHGSWFRPSGTQYSTALIRKSALKFGYKQCISYDVDSHDYQDVGKSVVIANVMKNVQNGSIISLHFGHQNTIDALPDLIKQLHDNGLKPVTLKELLG